MGDCFYYYHAGQSAVDTGRPWHLCCNATGNLLGQFSTWLEARDALDTIVRDLRNRPLPVEFGAWEKARLLAGATT